MLSRTNSNVLFNVASDMSPAHFCRSEEQKKTGRPPDLHAYAGLLVIMTTASDTTTPINFSHPARSITTDIHFARASIYSAATEDPFPARSFSFFCLMAKKIRSGDIGSFFIRTPVAS